MKGMGTLALIGIIILVIIVALGAYAYLTLSKYVQLGSPTQTYKALSANKTEPLSAVLINATQGFNTTEFTVSYSGNATIGIYGIRVTVPLNITLSRYYNDSRVHVYATGIPILGNVSDIQVKNGSSYYNCVSGLNSSKKGYSCTSQSKSPLSFLNSAYNGSSGNMFEGEEVNFGVVNQSTEGGLPCTNTNGYFSYSNSTAINGMVNASIRNKIPSAANITFLTCVSTEYKIPLTLKVYLTANASSTVAAGSLQLKEVSFSRNSSSAITALPGPIVNQT